MRQIVTAVDHLSGVWTRRGSLAALYGAGGVIIFLAIITKWFGFGSPMEPVEFIATLVIGLTFIVIAALFSYLEYRTAVQLFRAETKVWEEWEHVRQGSSQVSATDHQNHRGSVNGTPQPKRVAACRSRPPTDDRQWRPIASFYRGTETPSA